MIKWISYTQAKAVADYIRYLPGKKEDGDIWFCDWLSWDDKVVAPEKADAFQLGVYGDGTSCINDLCRILAKFGAYPVLGDVAEGKVIDTINGPICSVTVPIEHKRSAEIYIPDNLEQAFDDGIRMLTKYADFTFPLSNPDIQYLNRLLGDLNKKLSETSYDKLSPRWKFNFVEYEACLLEKHVRIYCTNPYNDLPEFNPSTFLCNIHRLHAIAKAIGADTAYHMHHGFIPAKGLVGLALVNENQKKI